MTQVLLTSCDAVKARTAVSDNLSAKLLRPSIYEAQEIGLRSILGDTLLDKCKSVIADNLTGGAFNFDFSEDFNIYGAEVYVRLIKECQDFLVYSACVELLNKVSYKVANAGLIRQADQQLVIPSREEINAQIQVYQSKADFFALRLQDFLLNNYADYPELTTGDCHRIKAHLHDAHSCGIFLGGKRGRKRGGRR